MKKKLRKFLSSIFPKGDIKEQIKLLVYNFSSPKATRFGIVKRDSKTVFETKFFETSLLTNEALYRIAPDFDYYQHFYKVKSGDNVIDAGANCGHLSIFFSKAVGESGTIFAFEPDNINIERINRNIKLNGLHDNISIQNLLLWDKNEMIDFYEAGTVGSSAVWKPDNAKVVSKEAVTIDSWVQRNNLNRLDFIKMDIEGAEIEALDGCVETIKNLSPNFAIASYHIVNGEPTYIKVEAFFKKMNYPYKTVRFRKNEIITFAGASVKQDGKN